MLKLLKENDQYNIVVSALRQELETTKREHKEQCSQMESQTMVCTLLFFLETGFSIKNKNMFCFYWPDMNI